MTTTIKAAGYIVTGYDLIHGYGATEELAMADALRTLKHAHIEVADAVDPDRSDDWSPAPMLRSELEVQPATAALLAEVKDCGGNIAWGERDGVACTRDEEDEAP